MKSQFVRLPTAEGHVIVNLDRIVSVEPGSVSPSFVYVHVGERRYGIRLSLAEFENILTGWAR